MATYLVGSPIGTPRKAKRAPSYFQWAFHERQKQWRMAMARENRAKRAARAAEKKQALLDAKFEDIWRAVTKK